VPQTGDARARAIADLVRQLPVYQDDVQTHRTLERNRDKDFVRRILNPKDYPQITKNWRLDPGQVATHQMSWTTIEDGPMQGKHIVYPNIIHNAGSNDLQWLDPKGAVTRALRTGEYIPFDTPEQADQFSIKYKRGAGPSMR